MMVLSASLRPRAAHCYLLLFAVALPSLATAQDDWADTESQLVGNANGRRVTLGLPLSERIDEVHFMADPTGRIRNLVRLGVDYFDRPTSSGAANDYPGLAIALDVPAGDPVVALTLDDQPPFNYLQIRTASGRTRSTGSLLAGESPAVLESPEREIAGLVAYSSGNGAAATLEGLTVRLRRIHEYFVGPFPAGYVGVGRVDRRTHANGMNIHRIDVRIDRGAVVGLRYSLRRATGELRGTLPWLGSGTGGSVTEILLEPGEYVRRIDADYTEPANAVIHALTFRLSSGRAVTAGTPPPGASRAFFREKPGAMVAGFRTQWDGGRLLSLGVLFRVTTGNSHPLGDACTDGGTIGLDANHLPQIGGSLDLQITSPSGTPFLMFSNAADPTPLDGCTLHVATWAVPTAFAVTAPTTSLPLPLDRGLHMLPLHFQGFDPIAGGPVFGAVSLTNAIAVQIGAAR